MPEDYNGEIDTTEKSTGSEALKNASELVGNAINKKKTSSNKNAPDKKTINNNKNGESNNQNNSKAFKDKVSENLGAAALNAAAPGLGTALKAANQLGNGNSGGSKLKNVPGMANPKQQNNDEAEINNKNNMLNQYSDNKKDKDVDKNNDPASFSKNNKNSKSNSDSDNGKNAKLSSFAKFIMKHKTLIIVVGSIIVSFGATIFFLMVVNSATSIISNFDIAATIDKLTGGLVDEDEVDLSDKFDSDFVENLSKVSSEFLKESKNVSVVRLCAIYEVVKDYDPNFDDDDMNFTLMMEIAGAMFLADSISFSEDGFYDRLYPILNRITNGKIKEDDMEDIKNFVDEYVDDYEDLFKDNNSGNICLSSGNTQATSFLNMTTDEYIQYMGPIAQADYSRTGVFASVTLAQSILESGWGKSGLTQAANNMFGMKCGSSWDGECVNYNTTEHYSSGTTQINAGFRKYNSVEDSVNDHSYLFERLSGTYVGVLTATNPQDQLRAIAGGGYATSPTYASDTYRIIQSYGLDQWDVTVNTTSNSCYTGETDWTIRTTAPTSNDPAFMVKNQNRGQCVWYAQARAYEVALELQSKGKLTAEQAENIRAKLFSIYGNAGIWGEAASTQGVPISKDIKDLKAGAIISWKKVNGYGHVAFIEEVTANSVTITEGWADNTTSCPSSFSCVNFKHRTISLEEYYDSFGPKYTGNYYFSAYIYPLEINS